MTRDPWLMTHDSCMPWDSWPEVWDLRHMTHDWCSWLIPWDAWFETWDLRRMRRETLDSQRTRCCKGTFRKDVNDRRRLHASQDIHVNMHHKTYTSRCITRHRRLDAWLVIRHTCTCSTCADDGTYLYTVTLCRLRHCNTLQHTSTHSYLSGCDTATHCNTLQHAAAHCKYTLSRLGVFSRVNAQRHRYEGCHVRPYRSRLSCPTT